MSLPWEDDYGDVAVESEREEESPPWEDDFSPASPEPDLVFGAPRPPVEVDSLAPIQAGESLEPKPRTYFESEPLPSFIPRMPRQESQDTLTETSLGFVTRLQEALPSIFGPPGEQPPDAIPRGALPALATILYGRVTEPGERPEPGVMRFSPKELIPPEPTVGGEMARQALGMVNIENLSILKGLGTLAKGTGPIADWAKAAAAAYFGKTGAEIAGQSLGELVAGGLTPTEQGERAFNVGLGGLMALGPGIGATIESARVRPFQEPPIRGSTLAITRGSPPVRRPAFQLPDADLTRMAEESVRSTGGEVEILPATEISPEALRAAEAN